MLTKSGHRMARLRQSLRIKKSKSKKEDETKKEEEVLEDPIQIEPFDKKSKFREDKIIFLKGLRR